MAENKAQQTALSITLNSTSIETFRLNVLDNKQNKFSELIDKIEVIIQRQLKAENFSVFVDGFITAEIIEEVRQHYRDLGWKIAPRLSEKIENKDSRIIIFLVDNEFFY